MIRYTCLAGQTLRSEPMTCSLSISVIVLLIKYFKRRKSGKRLSHSPIKLASFLQLLDLGLKVSPTKTPSTSLEAIQGRVESISMTFVNTLSKRTHGKPFLKSLKTA